MNNLKILFALLFIISSSVNMLGKKEKGMMPPLDETEESEELAA